MLEDERIGQMKACFEHRAWRAHRARSIKFDRGNNSAAESMLEILHEEIGASVRHDGKWVSIEATPVVGQFTPAADGMRA